MDKPVEKRSVSELTNNLGDDLSLLARQEVELAKAEFGEKFDAAKKDVLAMGTGGVLALAGVLVLLMGVMFGLTELGVALWLSAFLVGGVATVSGLVALRTGGKKAAEIDPVPRQAQQNIQRDFRATKEAMQ